MIDLQSSVQVLLKEAGFRIGLVAVERQPTVIFEDETLMGFVCVFPEPEALLSQWQVVETTLLTRFSPRLRAAGDKAWNVYCVLLCSATASISQDREVRWIEENLERTRKLAACGVGTRDELVRVLLPILPLRQQPQLQKEDVTGRLQARILAIAPNVSRAALDDAVSPDEVVRLLENSK